MARRAVRTGLGLGIGATIGVLLARVALMAGGVAFLVGWWVLSAAGVDWRVAFVLLVLAILALVALVVYARDLSRLGGAWATRHARQRTGTEPEWAVSLVPFDGAHYTFEDERKTRRYDGSAGDLESLIARLRDHCDPYSSSALAGKITPGWTLTVRFLDDRDEAYRSEGEAIDQHIGRPGYLNRRREGRGRVTA